MPSQICHLIFAEDTLKQALGGHAETILRDRGNVYRFGAQGPDFFYHNQRTKPTGLKFGVNAHRQGYGRLVANMIRELRHLQTKNHQELPSIKAYILGFVTHAFLDKEAHPFIDFFSGWVDMNRPETERYYRCHIFMERILDVLMLKIKRGVDIREFNLISLLDCGAMLPYGIIKTLVKSLHATYPNTHFKSRDRRRVENAYIDSMGFYTFIDPMNPRYRRVAWERDRGSSGDRRRLALFHPFEIPEDIDFLNLGNDTWTHPCNDEWRHKESFPELWEAAAARTLPVLREIHAILEGGENPERAEQLICNQSLGTGLNWDDDYRLLYNRPLPLPELLDKIYLSFDQTPAASSRSSQISSPQN
jgi:hypothetical protein